MPVKPRASGTLIHQLDAFSLVKEGVRERLSGSGAVSLGCGGWRGLEQISSQRFVGFTARESKDNGEKRHGRVSACCSLPRQAQEGCLVGEGNTLARKTIFT